MGLETGVTYISDLDANNPASTDNRVEGDDHIRNIKTGLLNTFPQVTGAVNANQTELNYLDGATPGTALASKALVVDANRDINTIGDLTADTLTTSGGTASMRLEETDAGVNLGRWRWEVAGGVARLRSFLDNGTGVRNALEVQHDAAGEITSTILRTTNGNNLEIAADGGGDVQIDLVTGGSGTFSLDLPSSATGDVYYRNASGTFQRLALGTAGQVLTVNTGATAPEWGAATTYVARVATQSGTAVTLATGIPASTNEIVINFDRVGMDDAGNQDLMIQLGTGAGPTWITTGYLSGSERATQEDGITTGLQCYTQFTNAAHLMGNYHIYQTGADIWVGSGVLADQSGNVSIAGGRIAAGAEVTAVRITTVSGTPTFDNGYARVMYK